jgi:exonuclease VII large subunit
LFLFLSTPQNQALKIELQVADDARQTLSSSARKSAKVATALRDRLTAEQATAQSLTEQLADAEARVLHMQEENERHALALQRTLEATQRERRKETERAGGVRSGGGGGSSSGGRGSGSGGDYDDGEFDFGSVTRIEDLIDWVIATVESHFLEWQIQAIDTDRCVCARVNLHIMRVHLFLFLCVRALRTMCVFVFLCSCACIAHHACVCVPVFVCVHVRVACKTC